MNSRVPSSAEGNDSSVRERAEAAARRAGMSLNEWLNSNVGESAPGLRTDDKLNQRLDTLTRQVEQISRPAPGNTAQPAQLNSGTLDFAIAEIIARQNELQNGMRSSRNTPVVPDMSGLERHLSKINSRIDELQRPNGVEQSIAAFRGELTEIRHAITEAMPRRAIESIENEIRSLAQRIDDTRQNGMNNQALAGVESALAEIREALRSLTSAEQLAGFDDTVRNLGTKVDLIVRANSDSDTIGQLEGAIAALRAIVSNVASNEALARLSDIVHSLSSKVDQFAFSEGHGDSFAALEQRIAALTSTLESQERPAVSESSEHLEGALKALSDRLDHLPASGDGLSAFAHLEQRVSYLLERVELSTEPRASNLDRVEEGLQAVLRHLEAVHAGFGPVPGNSKPRGEQTDAGLIDAIKRELSDLRLGQSETGRHTQDSLEIVHNTLGHVVDRLAMIEGDLRVVRSAPLSPAMPQDALEQPATPRRAMPQQPRPELPNPAAAQTQFAAAPREFHAVQPTAASAAAMAPRAISEILDSHGGQHEHAADDLALPPDHPLEPGTRPAARIVPPSERTAASEDMASELSGPAPEPASTTSFIAAARRAAKAAAVANPAGEKAPKAVKAVPVLRNDTKEPSTISSKIRSLLVGASVVVIVLGTFKMAMTLLNDDSAPSPSSALEKTIEPPLSVVPPAERPNSPAMQAPNTPSLTSPTSIGRQSLNQPTMNTPVRTAAAPIPHIETMVAAASPSAGDVTGTIPASQTNVATPLTPNRKLASVQIPAAESLPDAIGGPVLRNAALKGDASAAYEIAVRYSEGKGVAVDLNEAAKWYDRAAQAGVVPAVFRVGTLYEKGLGVKKDVDIAGRYYLQAAERGNAKAMHNLAVLNADGGGKGADYKSASQWFRKAAERGIPDSQFNLGILYARGIGVEQNLAESYKWFSLAAAQGDADSAKKRDDLAKRLDAQSLAAATLAIQTFIPEAQPDDAINPTAPVGGWDSVPAQVAAEKSATSKAGTLKRVIR